MGAVTFLKFPIQIYFSENYSGHRNACAHISDQTVPGGYMIGVGSLGLSAPNSCYSSGACSERCCVIWFNSSGPYMTPVPDLPVGRAGRWVCCMIWFNSVTCRPVWDFPASVAPVPGHPMAWASEPCANVNGEARGNRVPCSRGDSHHLDVIVFSGRLSTKLMPGQHRVS